MWTLVSLLFPVVFCQQINWNYYAGGNDWHQIWPTCSSTQGQQSPIDIHYDNTKTVTQAILYFEFFAKNVMAKVENNGYFLKSDFPWMAIQVNDNTGKVRKAQCFTLAFHAPSEHIIEGNRFDMEMQIACEDVIENGKYVNIALLFESERFGENQLIEHFSAAAANLNFNFEEALKNSLTDNNVEEYYTYTGSFTVFNNFSNFEQSPPCHHSVEWVILSKPIKISIQSLTNFQALWAGNQEFAGGSGNYRNIQLLKENTKFIKGKISKDLKPVDLVQQLNGELGGNKDNESDEFYEKKIDKYLNSLEKQKKVDEYQINVAKKAKFLEDQINALKFQLKQQLSNGDGANTDILTEQLRQKDIELEKFLENCSEYNENSNCDIKLPSSKAGNLEDLNDGIADNDDSTDIQDQQKEENSELTGKEETGQQVMITHDGQEIQMQIPEELAFIQTFQNQKRKLRRKRQDNYSTFSFN